MLPAIRSVTVLRRIIELNRYGTVPKQYVIVNLIKQFCALTQFFYLADTVLLLFSSLTSFKTLKKIFFYVFLLITF
jgi:hypothetical protein